MRDFESVKRIVIKIGTNTLTKAGKIDSAYVRRIAAQIASLLEEGRQIVVISSGAIGMGIGQLRLRKQALDMKMQMRQACAAIGQPLLMVEYRKAFARHGINVAQVLVTAEVLDNRKTYLNLRGSVEALLKLGVVPILNENDSVSTDEIGSAFGDNDKLSALVASKIDADLLIMLSDIDALYNRDPRRSADAKPISTVYEITDQIIRAAGKRGSKFAVGGMKSKLEAAKIAANAGCRMVLANGRARNVVVRILAGRQIGTVFMPRRKLSNRARWILNSAPAGTIRIDSGAIDAVRKRKSLLPSGVVAVEGVFNAGSVVMLNDFARAVTTLASSELRRLAGRHSTEIRKIFGPKRKDVVATPEDILMLD
jgi:glutamate 5-kinase